MSQVSHGVAVDLERSMEGCKQELKGTRQKKKGSTGWEEEVNKRVFKTTDWNCFCKLWLWFNPNHIQYCIQMVIRCVFLHVGKNGS